MIERGRETPSIAAVDRSGTRWPVASGSALFVPGGSSPVLTGTSDQHAGTAGSRMVVCPLLSELGQRRALTLPMLSEPVRDAGVAAGIRGVSRRAPIQAAAVVALGLTILSVLAILVVAA